MRKTKLLQVRINGFSMTLFLMLVAQGVFVPRNAWGATTGVSGESLFNEAIRERCVPPGARSLLETYTRQIGAAPTVGEARRMVLSQTSLARRALAAASWLVPAGGAIDEARAKLDDLERRVYAANTPSEVASDFLAFLTPHERTSESASVGQPSRSDVGQMMLAGGSELDKPAVSVKGSGSKGCDYTRGEIIIIVLGFLLFIIPGIIFLIIFC